MIVVVVVEVMLVDDWVLLAVGGRCGD